MCLTYYRFNKRTRKGLKKMTVVIRELKPLEFLNKFNYTNIKLITSDYTPEGYFEIYSARWQNSNRNIIFYSVGTLDGWFNEQTSDKPISDFKLRASSLLRSRKSLVND